MDRDKWRKLWTPLSTPTGHRPMDIKSSKSIDFLEIIQFSYLAKPSPADGVGVGARNTHLGDGRVLTLLLYFLPVLSFRLLHQC